MKSLLISVERQKKEIVFFLISFGIANILNIYSIIAHNGKWSELYSSIGYIFIAGCFIYALTVSVRIASYAIGKIFKKQTN